MIIINKVVKLNSSPKLLSQPEWVLEMALCQVPSVATLAQPTAQANCF